MSSLTSTLLLLICSTLVYSKQVPVEYATNHDLNVIHPSDTTLRFDDQRTDLLRTNFIETNNITTRQAVEKGREPKVKSSYVHLPEEQIRCVVDNDCAKHNLPLRCGEEGICECVLNLCWTYVTDTTRWPVVNVFTCDTCGKLGSACNTTNRCDDPGACMVDGYCHCRHNGEHDEDGICWIADTNWAMMIAVGAMGIILVFAIMVTAYNLYVTRPWRNGCGRRRATPDVLHQNETVGETTKTPAYSVRDYYGYTPVELPQDSSQPVQADGEVASTSSSTTQVDEETASTSTSATAADNEIQENNQLHREIPVQQDSTESSQEAIISRVNDSSAESSVRSSISSNASTVNSERPLVSTSGNNSTQNGHSNGFSVGRVFNRDHIRNEDHSDSTRF